MCVAVRAASKCSNDRNVSIPFYVDLYRSTSSKYRSFFKNRVHVLVPPRITILFGRMDIMPPSTESLQIRENFAKAEKKWSEICGEQQQLPATISLPEKMQQLGQLLGAGGRRVVLSSFCKKKYAESGLSSHIDSQNGDIEAFWNDIDDFCKSSLDDKMLANYSSLGKRGPESQIVATTTPAKRGKQASQPDEKSFKDRCIEWYKKETGAPEEPPESVMELFSEEAKTLQEIKASVLEKYVKLAFGDNKEMKNAFLQLLKNEASRAAAPPSPQAVTDETKVAFSNDYEDPYHVVRDFIGYVQECHEEYKKRDASYVAPYISLCQSSGYGKSRLLKQVSKSRKLLYVCVANESAICYPMPNTKARDFLFSKDGNDKERQKHLQEQLERCVSWCLQNDITEREQFGPTPDAELWDKIMVHEPTIQQDDEATIWIAFDEARSLLPTPASDGISDFRILRRALSAVSTNTGHRVFAIMVDTKSTIANFSPSKYWDSSWRESIIDAESVSLFHPYILLLTHDALKTTAALDFTHRWSFMSCGRPLWKSLYPDPSKIINPIIKFVARKLLKSPDASIKDNLALLATVTCRTGVYLSPQSSVASDLAANHMATLLLCDCNHEHFLVTYLSDPVLAMASAKLWYDKEQYEQEKNLLTRGLSVLQQHMIHGAVLEGYLGELVGRILLLIGMDVTTGMVKKRMDEARGVARSGEVTISKHIVNGYDGGWYNVSDFMEYCFGIKNCLVGEDAKVGFSHFVSYFREPKTYEELKQLLYRRGACCLPSGQPGIDLLIPFWKRTGTVTLISYILIQIKNKKKQENATLMRDKMNPRYCFAKGNELRHPQTDIILIMMQVGFSKNPGLVRLDELQRRRSDRLAARQVEQSNDDWKKWVYSVRAISSDSYPFLNSQDDLKEELVGLAKGSLDLESWMACDEKNDSAGVGMDRRKDPIRRFVLGMAGDVTHGEEEYEIEPDENALEGAKAV